MATLEDRDYWVNRVAHYQRENELLEKRIAIEDGYRRQYQKSWMDEQEKVRVLEKELSALRQELTDHKNLREIDIADTNKLVDELHKINRVVVMPLQQEIAELRKQYEELARIIGTWTDDSPCVEHWAVVKDVATIKQRMELAEGLIAEWKSDEKEIIRQYEQELTALREFRQQIFNFKNKHRVECECSRCEVLNHILKQDRREEE